MKVNVINQALAGAALRAGLLLTTAAVALFPAVSVQAQSATSVVYNIPPGKLSTALTRWAQASGVKLLAPAAALQGRATSGLTGSHPPQSALATLLDGTGLSYTFSGSTVTISNPGAGENNASVTVDGAIALDTIDVSGGGGADGAADEPYQTPGSVAYVSSEQLERVPATTPGDMLRDVPGVDIRGGNNGAQMDVSIRGQHGNNRVKVMVEGTQQESSSHQGYFGQDNSTFVDPDLISSITVEKGPSTGPYGGGASAGVVNMRTLTADDILLSGRNVGIRLRGNLIGNVTKEAPPAGNHPFDFDRPALFDFLGGSGSIAIAGRTDAIEIVAAATKREQGNYFAGKHGSTNYGAGTTQVYSRTPPGAEVLNTSQDSRSQLLKGTLRPGEGHSLEVGYLRSENDYGWIYPISANGVAQAPLSWMQSDRMWARYNWNPIENDLVNFNARVWQAKLQKHDQRWTASATPGTVDTWGAEIWNQSRFDSNVGLFFATYGAEYSKEEANLEGGYRGNHATRELASAYADIKWKPLDWLTFDAGVRYTTFETRGAYEAGGGTVEEGQKGSGVTPSASVTLEVADGLQLFGKYSEGYRPPSIRETVPQAFAGYPVNPTLRPEQSRNIEFGANLLSRDVLQSDDKLKVKLAYFNSRFDDYITIITPYDPDYYYHNIPGAKIDGIELSGSYSNGALFAEANFNYYTKFEYCYGQHPYIPGPSINSGCTQYLGGGGLVYGLSAPPKYSGSITLGAKLLDNKLTLGTTTRFFSKSVVPWKLPNGNFVFDAPMWRPDAIVDAFGSYKFNDYFEISASVENIFDRYYVDPMSIAKLPAPGRTFRVGATLKLDDQGNYSFDGVSMPEMTTAATGYNWSGAFIGLDGGYLAASASAEGDFAGTLRTGPSSAYVWNPYRSSLETEHEPGNLSGGLFAGYNVQLNAPVVLGVDANFGYVAATDTGEGLFTAPAVSDPVTRTLTTTVTSGFDWQAGVRGRIGIAFDRTLPFIAGGLAVAQYSYNYTSFALNQNPVASRTLPDPVKFKDTYLGWSLGAGVEHAMTDNLLLRAEYRYSDFGKKTFDTSAGAHRVDLTTKEWRLGLAYKF